MQALYRRVYKMLENFFKNIMLNMMMQRCIQKQPPEVFYQKKVLLKISQNSQENTFARVSF